MKLNVIVVDDHQLVRDGIASIIESNISFELLQTASNGKELLQILSVTQTLPDIILMDVDMPFMNGFETTKAIKKDFPSIRVVLLTMHDESLYYNKAVAVQVDGFLMKSTSPEELFKAMQIVYKGGTYFREKNNTRNKAVETDKKSNLTDREIEILKKIALGMSNVEISKTLGISVRTVDTHRTHLKKKLSVNNIAGLVRFAFEQGYLS